MANPLHQTTSRTMIAQDLPAIAPRVIAPQGPPQDAAASLCDLFRRRQDICHLLYQLVQIIQAVQRHRGMSMALLGGNNLFYERFVQLQQQLERRLAVLRIFVANAGALFSARDQQHLYDAWVSISRNWQKDSVIDNYELHCHLIEQLLSLLASLAKQLEISLPAAASAPAPAPAPAVSVVSKNEFLTRDRNLPNRSRYLEVLHFSTRLMPAVAEQIGRIRALSTYAAALGHCDNHHDGKLRYVIQCTRVNNEKLHHQTQRLQALLDGEIEGLAQLKRYEIKLMFLLDMIEHDVLGKNPITADSNGLFTLATDIMDTYLQMINQGLQLIALFNTEDLESWLCAD